MKVAERKLSSLQIAAIMVTFFTSMGVAAISPAMAKMASHFAGYDYALISTLPTLFIVPTTLWAGSVAGKRVSYRMLSTVGIILFLVGGLTPYFITNSFYVLLACRAVFGIGAGLRVSLGNALVMHYYTGKKQANMLGYGMLVTNLGGVVFQMAGGALAEIAWNYTFLAHLFGILALILVLFQPEPEREAPTPSVHREIEPTAAVERQDYTKAVGAVAFLLFLYQLLCYPVLMNMSLLFEARNAGGATVAATALSLYTVGGGVIGILFGKIFNRQGRFTIVVGYLATAAGAAILSSSATAWIMISGSVVMGMASSLLTPAAYAILGMYVPRQRSSLCVSVVMGASNLGGFLCPYYLKLLAALLGEDLYSGLHAVVVMCCLLTVPFLLWDPLNVGKSQQQKVRNFRNHDREDQQSSEKTKT